MDKNLRMSKHILVSFLSFSLSFFLSLIYETQASIALHWRLSKCNMVKSEHARNLIEYEFNTIWVFISSFFRQFFLFLEPCFVHQSTAEVNYVDEFMTCANSFAQIYNIGENDGQFGEGSIFFSQENHIFFFIQQEFWQMAQCLVPLIIQKK